MIFQFALTRVINNMHPTEKKNERENGHPDHTTTS